MNVNEPVLPPPAEIRTATPADLPTIIEVDGRAFGWTYSDAEVAAFAETLDLTRFLLAHEPGDPAAVVGVTGSFAFDVTLPGGAILPAAGVTWVSVAATHRRRGILRALMRRQHRDFLDAGLPLALLTASEAPIYGRFGYGEATHRRTVEIDRRFARFRADAPDPGGVRFVGADEAHRVLPGLHDRWCAVTPGALRRSDVWWTDHLADRPEHRRGGTGRQYLVHPDGYASYRIKHGSATTLTADVHAATPAAHAALWRVLLGVDLVTTVTSTSVTADDPLPLLLTDPRLVTTTSLVDGMWARILDVAAVLGARRYATEIDVVLEVTDPFLGRGGRFRLTGGPDGATCTPADTAPDPTLDIADLATLVFGARPAHALAAAGRLTVADPAVLRRLDVAFGTEREARHGTEF